MNNGKLQKSTLRPDVEPFVPKAQNGQPVYMVANGGFSLDAPEFVPNIGYTNNGDMYTWVSNQVNYSTLCFMI